MVGVLIMHKTLLEWSNYWKQAIQDIQKETSKEEDLPHSSLGNGYVTSRRMNGSPLLRRKPALTPHLYSNVPSAHQPAMEMSLLQFRPASLMTKPTHPVVMNQDLDRVLSAAQWELLRHHQVFIRKKPNLATIMHLYLERAFPTV